LVIIFIILLSMKFSDILTLEQKRERSTNRSGAVSSVQSSRERSAATPITSGSQKPKEKSVVKGGTTNTAGGFAAVLVGGLNYRSGDKSTSTQAQMLKTALGVTNVKSFDWDASTESILSFLSANPKTPVFLFSAGCKKAGPLSASNNVDINKLYIIEPYYEPGGETAKSVKTAVNNGVPSKNVFVGTNASRGSGIVSGTSSSNGSDHWDALVSVGRMFAGTMK
jgi:hypothetical protein